jgi:hypothetical protein
MSQANMSHLTVYPCPPLVKDIPQHKGSFGWISPGAVAADTAGNLWVDSYTVPQPCPGAPTEPIVAYTKEGLAIHAPMSAFRSFQRSVSIQDKDRWMPVAVTMAALPAHISDAIENLYRIQEMERYPMARPLPRTVPRGPWYRTHTQWQVPCHLCERAIPQATWMYMLPGGEGTWSDACLCRGCAYRCSAWRGVELVDHAKSVPGAQS